MLKNKSCMEKEIEKAIRETLVVLNKKSIKYAVDKILLLFPVIKCEHKSSTPEEAWMCDDCEDFTGWKKD